MPPNLGKLALAENASSVRSEAASRELSEKRYAQLKNVAANASKEHILASFRREYLDALLSYEKPDEACSLLLRCFDAYDRIQKLEENLDKMQFTELLRTGSLGMLSGTDKKGNNILWMQSPPGLSAYKRGSATTDAYVRATIYTIQVALIRIAPEYKLTIMYDDMSRTLLSFNSKVARELTSIAFAAFPLAAETVYYFAPRGTRAAWSGIRGAIALRTKSPPLTILTSKENAIGLVSDPSEIPAFWIKGSSEGPCVVYVPNWDNLWDFKRCIAKGKESISVAEVLNGNLWVRREAKITQHANVLIEPLRRSLDKRETGGVAITDEKFWEKGNSDVPARMIFVSRKPGSASHQIPSSVPEDDSLETIDEGDEDETEWRKSGPISI